MSGGSYDYTYARIRELADEIETNLIAEMKDGFPTSDTDRVYSRERNVWISGDEAKAILAEVASERRWFINLLRAVSIAAHDIEWVDSCDYGPGQEVEAIKAIRQMLKKEE